MTKKTEFNMSKFWWYINERERIRIAKDHGLPKPWTHDTTFQQYKFTNTFRQDDATSKILLSHLQHSDDFKPEEILFNIALFRIFNWGPTYEHCGGWCTKYVAANYKKKIHRYKKGGNKVFTGAYMVSGGGGSGNGSSKVDLMCDALTVIWKERKALVEYIEDFNTVEGAVSVLNTLPMVGKFVAYELACDLTYTKLLRDADDLNTWANPGPGAARGLNRVFRGEKDSRPHKSKQVYLEEMRALYKMRKKEAQKHVLKGRWPFDMRVIENALCETDKYLRIHYGEGRPRSRYPGV